MEARTVTDQIVALTLGRGGLPWLSSATEPGRPGPLHRQRQGRTGSPSTGSSPSPIARLVDEKLAAARVLFGDDIDLTAGSALRKLLETHRLEEARTWEHVALVAETTVLS